MQQSEYENIFIHEESHFYYRVTHELLLTFIRRYAKQSNNLAILDAGCGTGLFGKKLAALGKVTGVDISPVALRYAKKRGLSVVRASVEHLPFRDHSFDVITCVDVLYHLRVKDDIRALAEFYRVLKPHGVLIFRVPAISWLKTPHDRVVHTRHRYDKDELRNLIKQVGFHLRKLTYTHMILLPLALVEHFKAALFPIKSPHSSVKNVPRFINNLMIVLLLGENSILRYFRLPVGLGLVAVSEKR